MIRNPILSGFHPDPSIIRVDEDYYLATSTFEWHPGVRIFHSRDLVNWELIAQPLHRLSQLDLRGVPDSGGVWAPCLSYEQGVFYLVYSNVRSFDGVWKDSPNYLVTTDDIRGEWSDPIYLNARGFDGSLFHDQDGKKYYISMQVDHRQRRLFGGIILQEYDPAAKELIGPVHHIYDGTELGCTEGPHLYQKDGYYYLICAEGGTEYAHAVTFARSKNLLGPYETHPQNPILSAKDAPEAPLQKTGHADLVQDVNQNWWIVFLCGRPLTQRGRCPLGRETAIEELQWEKDQWPVLKNGGKLARLEIPQALEPMPESDEIIPDFNISIAELKKHFNSLRIPIEKKWCDLDSRPGFLRMQGQESLSSLHQQSLLARRVQHFQFEASTGLYFNPEDFQHLAGLVCYYNSYHWYYLHLSANDRQQRILQITACNKYETQDLLGEGILLHPRGQIELKVSWRQASLQFYYCQPGVSWQAIGPELDASILSDDYVQDTENRYRAAFTGAFVGICSQDLSGQKRKADFKYWTYQAID